MGKMKKFWTCIFSICVCMVMVASLAACGKSKAYKTVKDYLNADDVQKELKELTETYESQGISLELEADDSTLTYKYIYNIEIEPSDELTEAFDVEVANREDEVKEMVEELSKLVEAKNISIIFRYYSANGTELYSHEFK